MSRFRCLTKPQTFSNREIMKVGLLISRNKMLSSMVISRLVLKQVFALSAAGVYMFKCVLLQAR